jgi:bacterioferritin (cytochrome b1)
MACGRLVEQNPKCDEKESSEDAFALVEYTLHARMLDTIKYQRSNIHQPEIRPEKMSDGEDIIVRITNAGFVNGNGHIAG